MTTADLGLADALVRLAHLVDQVFGDVSRQHQLTPQQTQLICMLIDGPVGMSELGRRLNLEKSSLSGLVDRVERRGLIRRVRDTRDRRACYIALTEDGETLGNDSHKGVTAQLDMIAADLDPSLKDALSSAITRILDNDTASNGRTWRPGG